jgi:hypothetical protein
MWLLIKKERGDKSNVGGFRIIAHITRKVNALQILYTKYTEIVKINKYSISMIVLHDTIHYRDSIIHKYHMNGTTT